MNKTVILLLALSLLFAGCTREKQEPAPSTIAGIDALDVLPVEGQAEVLALWAGAGLKDVVYVHVASYSGLHTIEPALMADLTRAMDEGRLGQSGLPQSFKVDSDNFLYAAASLGIVREVYWIYPYTIIEDIVLAEASVREFLKRTNSGFDPAEVDRMTMKGGCLRGQANGVMINVCDRKFFPVIDKPVVLGFDMSFFPNMAYQMQLNKLGAVKIMLDAITLRQPGVIHAHLSYGIAEGKARPIHRYIGDQVIEALKDPQVLKAKLPPALWRVRDKVEDMLYAGLLDEALELLGQEMPNYPEDQALGLLEATALVMASRHDEAMPKAVALCDSDARYCAGLAYMGYVASLRGEEAQGRRFLDASRGRLPKGFVMPAASAYAPRDLAEQADSSAKGVR